MGHFVPQFITITFLKEIQTLIVGHMIDNFILRNCQKKLYKQGFDILKMFYLNNRFLDNGRRSRIRLLLRKYKNGRLSKIRSVLTYVLSKVDLFFCEAL